MKRPMRTYHPQVVPCPKCDKPIRVDEPVVLEDGQYRHAVNCTAPLRRRPKA